MKYPPHFQKLFESQADELINELENKWAVSDWKDVSRMLAIELYAEGHKLAAFETVGNDFIKKFKERKAQDKKRVENRADQVDKRAFQEAIKANIDGYTTKADAIRDLQIKPQFEKYPDKTLRGWLKGIWSKPTKRGRPKKAKE